MADKQPTEEERTRVLNKNAYIKLNTVFQILRCLDIASSRGSFKGNELSYVGSVYDTLSNGLNQAFKVEMDARTVAVTQEFEKLNVIKEE